MTDTKPKTKRAPTQYALFVKQHYEQVRNLPVRDRLKELSKMWKQSKEKPNEEPTKVPKKRGRKKKVDTQVDKPDV